MRDQLSASKGASDCSYQSVYDLIRRLPSYYIFPSPGAVNCLKHSISTFKKVSCMSSETTIPLPPQSPSWLILMASPLTLENPESKATILVKCWNACVVNWRVVGTAWSYKTLIVRVVGRGTGPCINRWIFNYFLLSGHCVVYEMRWNSKCCYEHLSDS